MNEVTKAAGQNMSHTMKHMHRFKAWVFYFVLPSSKASSQTQHDFGKDTEGRIMLQPETEAPKE